LLQPRGNNPFFLSLYTGIRVNLILRFALMKIRILLATILVALCMMVPAFAADSNEQIQSAGALYSQSVDLANAGKYQEALAISDKALAMNVTSLTGLIQSNRAGILVMLNRNNEAITAADAALAIEGNLTTVHAIAWFNKGNALHALGRDAEAKDAYAKAYALDNSLVPPVTASAVPATTTKKTPSSLLPVMGALGIITCFTVFVRKF
jgi:tetratricopeptide (TPR) repeat protein